MDRQSWLNNLTSLYIIECNGLYKIGITKDIGARVKSMQTGNPYSLIIRFVKKSVDAKSLEKSIHDALNRKGLQCEGGTEWFRLDNLDALIDAIEKDEPPSLIYGKMTAQEAVNLL